MSNLQNIKSATEGVQLLVLEYLFKVTVEIHLISAFYLIIIYNADITLTI